MAKKKKDNSCYDQMRTLEEINDILDGISTIDGSVLDSGYEERCEMENTQNMLEEMLMRRAQDDYEESAEASFVDTWSMEPESDVESQDVEIRHNMNEISINIDDNDIVHICDGVRDLMIDTNALLEDDVNLSNIDVADTVLKEICSNFRPSAYFTPSSIECTFEKIESLDDDKFVFVNSRNDNGVVLGYYISESSKDAFDEIVAKLHEREKIVSFLAYLYLNSESMGFSVNFYDDDYLDKLSLTTEMRASTELFIERLFEDDGTVTIKDSLKTVFNPLFDITSVQPAGVSYMSETRRDLVNIINNRIDESIHPEYADNQECDMDTSYENTEIHQELSVEEDNRDEEMILPDDEPEIEEVVVKASIEKTDSEVLIEEPESSDDGFLSIPDAEEVESEVISTKPLKLEGTSNDEFVVKVRK